MSEKTKNVSVVSSDKYEKFLSYASIAISKREKTISVLTKEFNRKFGFALTDEAFSSRIKRYRQKQRKMYGCAADVCDDVDQQTAKQEFEQINDNGSIDALKIVKYCKAAFGDERKMLEYIGYDPDKWAIKTMRRSVWQQKKKGDSTDNLWSVRMTVVPRTTVDPTEYVKYIKEIVDNIEPLDLEPILVHDEHEKLDDRKMLEIAPIELHLGKMAFVGESGQDYEIRIARNRFEKIFKDIISRQKEEKCGKCLLVIGSDFFNSESDGCTSVHKIPQANVAPYKVLMQEGFSMYASAIEKIRGMFNSVDVILCAGNHARSMEFFLYFALQQYFKNDLTVSFREDYKETQAVKFGNCAVFFNHGDYELKRTIKSIPAEFYDIWGKTMYRELHLGHMHKEMAVDDEGGMITRRIGAPTATDTWHYQNRFIGAVQKHQIFVWDADTGLKAIYYINVDQVN